MRDAIAFCIKYAFLKMNVERMEAVMLPENVQSEKVLIKLGFVYEGILRQYKFFRHKMRDVKSFSFTKEDYNKYFK
jgi:ribosomal-protein-alanine N-acetyltransferase